jgi:hypothetical protein
MRSLPPVFCADPFGQGAKLKIRSNLSHHQFTQDHIGFPHTPLFASPHQGKRITTIVLILFRGKT